MLEERIEAAPARQSDGGYELDGEIARLLGWSYKYREGTHSWGWCRPELPDHYNARPPAFTTSIDAAMTLVPEGWAVNITRTADGQYGGADLYSFTGGNEIIPSQKIYAAAATPALALCAAALKARKADNG